MKNFILLLKTLLVAILLIAANVNSVSGQVTTLFSTDMGSSNNGFAVSTLSNSQGNCSGTIKITTGTPATSATYEGATNGSNLSFAANGTDNFVISDISTVGFTDLQLSFGLYRQGSTSNPPSGFNVTYQFGTGTVYTITSFGGLPASNSSWGLVTASIPNDPASNETLTITFQQPGGTTTAFRLDDIKLEGTSAGSTTPLSAPANVTVTNSNGVDAFDVSWDAVTNANGYTVNVYKGTSTTPYATYSVTGGSTTSYSVKYMLPDATGGSYICKVIALGSGSYSNSPESDIAASNTFSLAAAIVNEDFSNGGGNWPNIYTGASNGLSGACANWNSTNNNFEITNGIVYSLSSITGPKGETHAQALVLNGTTGTLILPTISSVEQVEIHALTASATANRSFTIKEWKSGGGWTTITDMTVDKVLTATQNDDIFIIHLSRPNPTKLQIVNTGSGLIYYTQVIVRPTDPALLATPTVNAATNVTASGFTANWQPVANATGYKIFVTRGTTTDVYTATGTSYDVSTSYSPLGATPYTYKVVALGDGVNYLDSYVSNTVTVVVYDGPISWTGTTDTDWTKASNWDPAQIPGAGDDVIISAGTNYPVLSANVTVMNLTIEQGAGIDLSTFALSAQSIKAKATMDSKQWYSIGFPFDVTAYSDDEAYQDEVLEAGLNYWLKNYDGTKFNIVEGTTTITAGSYIIQLPSGFGTDAKIYYVSGAVTNFVKGELSFTDDTYVLQANPGLAPYTIDATTLAGQNNYVYQLSPDGKVYQKVTGNATIAPFESIITYKSISFPAKTTISLEEITGMDDILNCEATIATEYYNLQGQMITSPQPGNIYLVKKTYESGKTQVVKQFVK